MRRAARDCLYISRERLIARKFDGPLRENSVATQANATAGPRCGGRRTPAMCVFASRRVAMRARGERRDRGPQRTLALVLVQWLLGVPAVWLPAVGVERGVRENVRPRYTTNCLLDKHSVCRA